MRVRDGQQLPGPVVSAFAERSPAQTQVEGGSFGSPLLGSGGRLIWLPSPGEHLPGLLSFPLLVLRPWFIALNVSPAPFVPQGLVLLLRANQGWEAF